MLGFGGPAAHIAMFREEAVARREWISDQRFMDLVGATSLIPGPNSTEMAIHLGLERAGWRGLVAAGALFILPAFLIVTGLAWVYVEFNEAPALQWALYGIKPAVIAIVVNAIVGLAKTALGKVWTLVLAVGVLTLYIVGVNELILLAAAGGIGLLARAREWPGPGGRALFGLLPLGAMPAVLTVGEHVQPGPPVPAVSQDWRGALRQRLRAAGVHAGRLRGPAGLADPAATAGRRGGRAR